MAARGTTRGRRKFAHGLLVVRLVTAVTMVGTLLVPHAHYARAATAPPDRAPDTANTTAVGGKAAMQSLLEEIRQDTEDTRHYTGRASLSEAVMNAMARVDREKFVPRGSELYAWENRPLPIGYGQTISQPFIVALMTDLLELEAGHKVLELGTGSAYQAAVLATLGAEVYTIEIIPQLAASAAERLETLGYRKVKVRAGDGWHGWPEAAPFDRIIVTAVGEDIPPALLAQLSVGGRMVLPLGPRHGGQNLTVVKKTADGIDTEQVLPVQFVPLTRADEHNR
ncbi:MAG: protein-L-isoaspartate(D-aspartate) O-methyltransferase [Pseudomonadota bacterium]